MCVIVVSVAWLEAKTGTLTRSQILDYRPRPPPLALMAKLTSLRC
jgi:hypothetical protein